MTLVRTFVDDFLDLRLIKDGALSLKEEVFDPSVILEMICDIFGPQA